MQATKRRYPLIVGSALFAFSFLADAQALFVARRAIGRIEQMAQSSPATGAAYDIASVIVEVAPEKVFATVKRLLGQSSEVRVTRVDEAKHSVEFTDGTQIGGIQVNALNDNLAQMIVSTAHPGIPTSTTSMIVARILNVCRELAVVCQRPDS